MNALKWLSAVWIVLAVAVPSALGLDVHGQSNDEAQQLLSSSVELARWLNLNASYSASYIADAALRVMWRWGWNSGVGRLI